MAKHLIDLVSKPMCQINRDVARGGGAEGAAAPPLSLIERFSKDDTTP